MATFAAGLSEHPLATHAVGEVVGEVLEGLDGPPDVAVLFVTAPHTGVLEDIVRAVRRLCNPRVLFGGTAMGVLGGAQEVEERAAVVLWAARWGAETTAVRLDAHNAPDGTLMVAGGPSLSSNDGTLLLFCDPFSFPAEQVVQHLRTVTPGLTIIGGLASAARGPGGNRLVVDDEIFTDGAVGVHLPADVAVRTVVSQGCRPIGSPMTVTAAERNVIYQLAGQPALERVETLIESLSPDERRLAAAGLHIGRVIDEHQVDFARGDFLVRGVMGADRENGAVVVGDVVNVGDTVQFQVRDASTADEDLREMLVPERGDAALVFTCNGRGVGLFDEPDHDSAAVSEAIGGGALAGAFCAGEIGPVGARSFVHGFTASVAVFDH